MKLALVALFVLAASPAAFAKGKAKGGGHCVGSDGSEMADAKTMKACKKAGGKWEKMAKKGGGMADTASPSGESKPK